jgi:hypothetical protein
VRSAYQDHRAHGGDVELAWFVPEPQVRSLPPQALVVAERVVELLGVNPERDE